MLFEPILDLVIVQLLGKKLDENVMSEQHHRHDIISSL